jgi:hypothetical protein
LPNSNSISSDKNAKINVKDFDENVIIGKKKTNPYSVVNINKALNELKYDNKPKKLEANYYYVRLEPTDSLGFNFLEKTREIYAYQTPLDHKLENNGSKYKEPDFNGKFQVFWAAIPINYKLPDNINVKIIEDLFLPLGDGHDNAYAKGYDEKFLKALETKTQDLFDEDSYKNKKAKVTAYGTGYVRVFDDYLNVFRPIFNVEVRMKRWFTTRYANTYSNGYFENYSYNFNGPVDFSIGWLNTNFDIKNGNFGTAGTNENNVSGLWTANINKTGTSNGTISQTPSYIFAHVFLAAYNYYYYNANFGIKTPPKYNSALFGNGRLNIRVRPNAITGSSHFFFTNVFGTVDPSVIIDADPNNSDAISSRRLFASTTHELAHASHWELGFTMNDYLYSRKKATLAESWAMGVEWFLTNSVYGSLAASQGVPWTNYERPDQATQPKPINYWLYYDNGITVGNNRDDYYTPLFIDLMDYENQSKTWPQTNSVNGVIYNPSSFPPDDIANGFTLGFLESKLTINTTSWVGLKNTLISTNPTSSSTASIQYLFDNYEN